MLVLSGTATHWLFLHLGTATLILSLIVWTILRLLHGRPSDLPEEVRENRMGLRQIGTLAFLAVFIQMILGALVAGSRANGFVAEWPLMNGALVPPLQGGAIDQPLWRADMSMAWNLIDNPYLHQWIHRWFAWVAAAFVALQAFLVLRDTTCVRGRMAAQLSLTFLVVQIVLGLSNVFMNVPTIIALGHLLTGMLLTASVVLVNFDLRNEPESEAVADADTSATAVSQSPGEAVPS